MISKTLGTPWEHISNTAGSSSTTASSRVKLFMVRIGDEKHEVYTSHDSDQKRPSMSQKRPSMISTDTLYFNIYQIYIYNENTFNINSRIG